MEVGRCLSLRASRSPVSPRRQLLGGVVLAAAFVLTACNPMKFTPDPDNTSFVNFSYTGPSNAWVQMRIIGADGYGLRFRATVPGAAPWVCADGITGAPTACAVIGDYLASSFHDPQNDAPGLYWPTVKISGGWGSANVECSSATVPAACPATMKVLIRTVDDDGRLVGDLDVFRG